jgi:uncharacterized protein (TIGR00251 family)
MQNGGVSAQSQELRDRLLEKGSLMLDIKVVPRAQTGQVLERMANGALKLTVTAPPEKGKANAEVCEVLAAFLNVPKRNVEVVLGHTSRQKRVRILS